ncbi:hypothetical protein [Roseospira goensis]|uniref:Calcium-binding protein n=1 Tax=Roseospira goensis TaxID=391922 RepID=A0A7W6S203_9PROT|nr:hypothetical protein [Roseospira goensis]MBB4286930.1 hypothetical protein [Roseospira goensis]
MAIGDLTAQQQTNLNALGVAMFNAAPGATVLDEWAAAVSAGTSIDALANALTATELFVTQFDGLTTLDAQIGLVLTNLGLTNGTDAYTEAQAAFRDLLQAGTPVGTVIVSAADYLLNSTSRAAIFDTAAQTLANKVEVAAYYGIERGQSADTLAELQSVLDGVTDSSASVDTAKAAIDAASGATLTVTVTGDAPEQTLDFGGTASGTISMTLDGDNVATISRGGVTATTNPDLDEVATLNVATDQRLALTKAQLDLVTNVIGSGGAIVEVSGVTQAALTTDLAKITVDLGVIGLTVAAGETGTFDVSAEGGFVGAVDASAAGSVTLVGGDGIQRLTGGTQNDNLTGGVDADLLTGGSGADTFIYAVGDGSQYAFEGATVGADASAPSAGDSYTSLEVITDFNTGGGGTMTVANAGIGADAGTAGRVEANEAVFVAGSYDSDTGVFTVGDGTTDDASNADLLVLWDGDAADGVQQEAVVLVGIDTVGVEALTPGFSGADLFFA